MVFLVQGRAHGPQQAKVAPLDDLCNWEYLHWQICAGLPARRFEPQYNRLEHTLVPRVTGLSPRCVFGCLDQAHEARTHEKVPCTFWDILGCVKLDRIRERPKKWDPVEFCCVFFFRIMF